MCRLIGEVEVVGGGGGEYDNVVFSLPAASLCAEVVAEIECGWEGGGGYDNVSFSALSVCVQINW